MKPIFLFGLGLLIASAGAATELTVGPAPDLRMVFSTMIAESDHNFENRFGAKIKSDAGGTYYNAKPFEGMVSSQQLVALIKGYDFFVADLSDPRSMKTASDAFFSMPQFNDGHGTYTLEADKGTSAEGKEVTNLLLNGRRVCNYTHYTSGKEDILMVGPFGGRPGGPAAASAEAEKTRVFGEGTKILIDRAAGNFAGMTKDLIRKTEDGDQLYLATLVPEMQADADAQVIMQMGEKRIYMNSYDDEKSVAFAFASFLALPKNAPNGVYAVEVDSRLEKPSSTTYHLRYNGAIVADFIKYKLKPKALFSFGYRDGIPQNLAGTSGRTYSQATIEETKRMINENTVCPGCHGSKTEEVKTDMVYVGSGLPKMKTVPCHFCNGTGHL